MGNEFSQIADIQSRITRCFQPQQPGSINPLTLCLPCRWCHTNLDTPRSEVSFGKHAGSVVAIGRQDQGITRVQCGAKHSCHYE